MRQTGINTIVVLALCILLMACHRDKPMAYSNNRAPIVDTLTPLPPNVFISTTDSALKNSNGFWLHKGDTLNGYLTEYDGEIRVTQIPVINGRENGWAISRYASGKKKFKGFYRNCKREYVHTGWHENETIASVFTFADDKFEGPQYSYFKNGRPYQFLNYKHGYEEGLQQTWNEEGRLINNFTVKNGKLYGVVGRYDCGTVHKGN